MIDKNLVIKSGLQINNIACRVQIYQNVFLWGI